ncbi:oxygenase MpaB family protein [Rhodococcus koreensis]
MLSAYLTQLIADRGARSAIGESPRVALTSKESAMFARRGPWLGTNDRYVRLRRIEALDPVEDCREITKLFYEDFGSVMIGQLAPSLMSTYAAPRMSRILASSGELQHRFTKRLVDTLLLHAQMLEHGYSPGPGREAAKRVNEMHRQYDIHPDDFVSQSCEATVWPIHLAENYGWRPVTDIERRGLTEYNLLQGKHFNVKNAPETYEGMVAFRDKYLDDHCFFEPQNRALADSTLTFFESMVPAPLGRLMPKFLLALTDPRIVVACGYKNPGPIARRIAGIVLKLIGKADPVRDGSPDFAAELASKIYPDGWEVQKLGTHVKAQQPQTH